TKTETKSQTEQKVQHLQNQLSQIKKTLTTLNNNITQTESSLQQKRTEQVQTPQNNNLQTTIKQLEQQLTTYQAQKQKIEAILPKLEQQISNLSQGNNSEPEQEQVIQQLEQEIKEINQELGITEEPNQKKPNNPKPHENPNFANSTYQDLLDDLQFIHDYLTKAIPRTESNPPSDALAQQKWQMELDSFKNGLQEVKDLQNKLLTSNKKPNKNPNSPDKSQNVPTFQTLQNHAKELVTEIDKINKDYEKVLNE
ncbi:4959_t:CDS:2, partial [Entrophospora sp. SA101]